MVTTPKTVRLARLPSNWQDQPQLLERYWDESMTAIEKTLNAILQIPGIQDALDQVDVKVQEAKDAADAAQAAAENAQTSADGAQTQTDAQRREVSLQTSYLTGYTGNLISVNSAGNVTIQTHQRVYGDSTLNPTVIVNGDSFTTEGATTDTIRIYYNDPSRAGGSVSYQYTIDPAAPPVQTGDTHSVGAGMVPAAGIRPGKTITPPGYVEV